MKKIPTLFIRGSDRLVTDQVTPGCEWVLAGEGEPTVKWDGTACMIRDLRLYKRYDCKKGRTPPEGFEPCEPEPDPVTGHWPGWVPVGEGPEDQYHREAYNRQGEGIWEDGTYELIGTKVQGNPYNFSDDLHYLKRHGVDKVHPSATCRLLADMRDQTIPDLRTDLTGNGKTYYELIRDLLKHWYISIEGIVWYHPDGRMAKIKRKDFGLEWPMAKIIKEREQR